MAEKNSPQNPLIISLSDTQKYLNFKRSYLMMKGALLTLSESSNLK